MKKFDWASFFSNILSVVLGIFITFGIQGMIDRRAEKKEVKAALELVREELVNNEKDLQDVIGIFSLEKEAARFISMNKQDFSQCNPDSLIFYNNVLGSEYFYTVTDDALELLKSSSLFQKINDKNLALGIIKSYDYLNANSQAFNTHEKYKEELYKEVNTEKTKKASLSTTGTELLKMFYSSDEAGYFLQSVVEIADDTFLKAGLPDIEATIEAIEARLK